MDATFGLVAACATGTSATFQDIPGLTQTITVPEGGGIALIATDGGLVSSSATASGFVDVRLTIDSAPVTGALRRVCVEGTSSAAEPHGVWSMTRVIPLGAGSHTVKVQAARVNTGTGPIVSGPSGSVYQATLSVNLIKP